ncbi:MAG: SPOR domain-containing protein [Rhizobacter sp.]|nr:SPOR domain-containing protein [Rhizobacter sp.]
MGLLSFLKRKSGDAGKVPAIPESADSVQRARTRARQRLIGAVVLVAAGVIGFPLLFDNQPRPLPGDTPIVIARNGVSPAVPAGRGASTARTDTTLPPPSVVTEPPADAAQEVAAASVPAPAKAEETPADKPAAQQEPKPEPKPEAKPSAKPEPKPATKAEAKAKPAAKPPVDSARAQALLDGKATGKPAAGDGRFIVQVGAFADATAAREARQKVEKLGLKTYTQVVETSGGKRIRVRVGPFASREEADKASARIKSAGLSSAVYTL